MFVIASSGLLWFGGLFSTLPVLVQFSVQSRGREPWSVATCRARVRSAGGSLSSCGPSGFEYPCYSREGQLHELPVLQPAGARPSGDGAAMDGNCQRGSSRMVLVEEVMIRASGCSARAVGCMKSKTSQLVQKKVVLCLLRESIIRPSSFLFGRGSCTRASTPPNHVVQATGASSLGIVTPANQ